MLTTLQEICDIIVKDVYVEKIILNYITEVEIDDVTTITEFVTQYIYEGEVDLNNNSKCKSVIRTMSNIYDKVFLQNCDHLLAVNYFLKKVHLRCLSGSKIHF